MKKIFLLLLLFILNICFLNAEQLILTDSLFLGQVNIKASYDSTYNSLDTNYLPINLLVDKTFWFYQPESYSGTINSDTLNKLIFYQLYSSIRNSYYSIPNNLIPMDSLKQSLVSYDSSFVPIGFLFFKYSRIKQNAFDDTLLIVNNEIIYDVAGRSSSPYETDYLFASMPLRTILYDNSIHFKIDSSIFYYSNLLGQIDSILINFDDGNGFVRRYLNDSININYSINGMHTIITKIYSNGNSYLSFSNIYLNTASNTPRIHFRDYSQPDMTFRITADKAYNGTPSSGTIYVYYGCGNQQIMKPYIVLPGWSPPFLNDNNKTIISQLNGGVIHDYYQHICNNNFA